MYGNNQQQRQPQKPGNGRVWPAKERRTQNSPHFTGIITLPDGRPMRVSLWEAYKDRGQGPFNGFSIKLSEDTQQGNGYHAQGAYGNGGAGYGQGGGAPPQNHQQAPYGAQQGGYAGQPPAQQGYAGQPPQQQPQGGYGHQPPPPPPHAYEEGDQGYVPGFDD